MSKSASSFILPAFVAFLVWTCRLSLAWFPSAGPPADGDGMQEESKSIVKPQREVIRVSADVQESKLTYKVDPVYPPLAKKFRVQGEVILEVTVSENGDVAEVKVVGGHLLLINAALDAVKQWRYSPTYSNGEPVPAITTVTLVFTGKEDGSSVQTPSAAGKADQHPVHRILATAPRPRRATNDEVFTQAAAGDFAVNAPACRFQLPAPKPRPPFTLEQNNADVTTVMEAMRAVHGPLPADQEAKFNAKWGKLLAYPTDESIAYFNQLVPLLEQFLAMRKIVADAARDFDKAWAEAVSAAALEDERAARTALKITYAHKQYLECANAGLAELVKKIEALLAIRRTRWRRASAPGKRRANWSTSLRQPGATWKGSGSPQIPIILP